jgi:hypothetical protein
MAIHAYFSGGDTGEFGSLDRGVAIATVNAIVTDMVLMAELNRLLLLQITSS